MQHWRKFLSPFILHLFLWVSVSFFLITENINAQLSGDDLEGGENLDLEDLEIDLEDLEIDADTGDTAQVSTVAPTAPFIAESPPLYVFSPTSTSRGKLGTRSFYQESEGLTQQHPSFSAGVTDWLSIGLEVLHKKKPGRSLALTAYKVSSIVQLTEIKDSGEFPSPLDIGLYLAIAAPSSDIDPYEIEGRLLLLGENGPWQTIGNLIIEKEFGNSLSDTAKMAYANQIRYRVAPYFQPGLEILGRLGRLDNISVSREQHLYGPGLFGSYGIGEEITLKYELTLLLGLSSSAPNHSIKSLLKFEY